MREMKEFLILLRQLDKNRSGYDTHGELGKILRIMLNALAKDAAEEAQRKLNTE